MFFCGLGMDHFWGSFLMQQRTAAFGGTSLNKKMYNIVSKHNFMGFSQNGAGSLLGNFFNAVTSYPSTSPHPLWGTGLELRP